MGIDISSIFNHPDGNLSVYLECFGKEYEVKQFSTSFYQPVDGKGEPQSDIRSGTLLIALSTIPDSNIVRWATSDTQRQSGSVVFKNETETSALRIYFTDGICVGLTQKVNMGSGCITSFSITAPKITINDMLIDKNWVK